MEDRWYVLVANEPMKAKERCRLLKERYEEDTHRTFSLVLRTPNEYVGNDAEGKKLHRSEARNYLFRYLFAQADFNELDAFLRYRKNGEAGMRILGRRIQNCTQIDPLTGRETVIRRATASTVSGREITAFFSFCEAYARLQKSRNIPFVDYTPELANVGDKAMIIHGDFEGQTVTVAAKGEGQTQVLTTWFDAIAVPVWVKNEDLKMMTPERFANNKFRDFDEFFFYYSVEENLQRILSQPVAQDLMKALKMKDLAFYDDQEKNHARRCSKKLKVLNLGALVLCHWILGNRVELNYSLKAWERLRETLGEKEKLSDAARLVEIIRKRLQS